MLQRKVENRNEIWMKMQNNVDWINDGSIYHSFWSVNFFINWSNENIYVLEIVINS
jgi:hypothetical protein